MALAVRSSSAKPSSAKSSTVEEDVVDLWQELDKDARRGLVQREFVVFHGNDPFPVSSLSLSSLSICNLFSRETLYAIAFGMNSLATDSSSPPQTENKKEREKLEEYCTKFTLKTL